METISIDVCNTGRNRVCKEVVTDKGLATSRNPKDLPAFLRQDRSSKVGIGNRLGAPEQYSWAPVPIRGHSFGNKQKRPGRNRTDLPHRRFTPLPVHPWSKARSDASTASNSLFQRSPAMPTTMI
jgi:hypothetical protein